MLKRSISQKKKVLPVLLVIFAISIISVIIIEIPSSSIEVQQVNIERDGILIKGIANGLIVQAITDDGVWASRGFDIYYKDLEETQFRRINKVPVSMGKSYLLGFRTIRYLLNKQEVLELLVVQENSLVAFAGGAVFQSINNGGSFLEVDKMLHYGFRAGRGIMPQGYTTDRQGNIFWGEYWNNMERTSVRLLKSYDGGSNWVPVKVFESGEIRHIHSVQYDPYFDAIWVTTGDLNEESKIMYSNNGGETFEEVGSGTQKWRAVSLIFSKNKVYWGMDGTTRDTIQIWCWDRLSGETESMARLKSEVYYSTRLDNGTMFISNDGTKGHATLWACKDETNWEQVFKSERKWKTHYGTIRISSNRNNCILSILNLEDFNNDILFIELN